MKTVSLAVAAVGEATTGLLLLAHPPIVVRLLFGAEIAGAGVVISRIAGMALIALGLACWPTRSPLCGILSYSAMVAVLLAYLGIRGEWAGPLLWPAVGLHSVLTLLLARAWLRSG